MKGSKGGGHHASSTQPSVKPSGKSGGAYTSGANVGSGRGPGPSKPAPASQPKKQTY